jgi:hypothetical protein
MRIVYELPTDDQFERSVLELLKSQVRNFPEGEWKKSEAPDFLLDLSEGHVLGLEVTRPIDTRSSRMAAIRSAQEKVLRRTRELLSASDLEPVEVKVKFRSDSTEMDPTASARDILGFVRSELPMLDDTKTWHYYESRLESVDWISIHRGTVEGKRWLRDHRVSQIHINWVSVDPLDAISDAINHKNDKHWKYRLRCDECWLALAVNEWTAPEAIDITDNLSDREYLSEFSRLFFVRAVEGKVVELCAKSVDA